MGLPAVTIQTLQKVQNMCAKLVLRQSKYTSNTQALRDLHWLPVMSRIVFKVLSIVYKTLHDQGPNYLKQMLIPAKIMRKGLRSEKQNSVDLCVPFVLKKTHANRAFSVMAPKLWNLLPSSIQMSENLESFKKDLKTFLFNKPDFMKLVK